MLHAYLGGHSPCEIHLKHPCILIFFWKTDKWDPSSSSLINHFTPLFPNNQTKLQHISPSTDRKRGPGGRGGGVIQRTSTGLGLRRSMTGPPALPPASSMMLEEVGSHLGLRVNSLNRKTRRVSQVICSISSSSDPRISVQKAAESHSQRAAQ